MEILLANCKMASNILSGFIVNTPVLFFRHEASAHKKRAAWIDGISPNEKTRVNLVFDGQKQRDLDNVFLLPIGHWESLFVTNITRHPHNSNET